MRLFFVTFRFISACPCSCMVLSCDGSIPPFKELSQIYKGFALIRRTVIMNQNRTDGLNYYYYYYFCFYFHGHNRNSTTYKQQTQINRIYMKQTQEFLNS